MAMIDFKSLQIWQKSHKFTVFVYKASQTFPKEELYGLTSQIRRASVSIPSNIAEGCGRDSDAELARFCQLAMGSASEVEYQLLLANELSYLADPDYKILEQELAEIKRMLNAFIRKVRERI